jgi:hypothetical protein
MQTPLNAVEQTQPSGQGIAKPEHAPPQVPGVVEMQTPLSMSEQTQPAGQLTPWYGPHPPPPHGCGTRRSTQPMAHKTPLIALTCSSDDEDWQIAA